MAGSGVNTFTYDTTGRMTSDGSNSYTWDRANRLLTYNGAAYAYGYDGAGKRIQPTNSGTVTQYLNDVQQGLWQVLSSTTSSNTTRHLHGPLGIQQQQNPGGAWIYPVQDGLGSVREVVDNTLTPLESRLYSPYGQS